MNLRLAFCWVALLYVSTFDFASPAWAEKRVALVIGNSAYEHTSQLKNPTNDARSVVALFSKHGFDTELKLDLDRRSFIQALSDFTHRAEGADVAIFYYAGHGVSLDGRNYLIPTDSVINRAIEVKLGAGVDAELAIDQALANAKVKLIFLDACRDNPFVEQIKRSLGTTRSVSVASGLSEMKSGAGTLISFSTAPGQVALDGEGETSPFAAALVKHLSEPGLEIRLAMTKVRGDVEKETEGKQVPWESTNLTGFYYLSEIPPQELGLLEDAPSENESKDTAARLEAETEFWRSIKDSTDPLLFKSYLNIYPGGVFRPIAEARLKELLASTTTADVSSEKVTNRVESAETAGVSTKNEISLSDPRDNVVDPPDVTAEAKDTFAEGIEPKTKTVTTNTLARKGRQPNVANDASEIAEDRAKLNKNKPAKPLKEASRGADEAGYLTNKVKKNGEGDRGWTVPSGAIILKKSIKSVTVQFRGKKYKCVWQGGTGDAAGGRCSCRAN
ncbi:caspase domain-containing protein [Aestuariivirga sp.]|uniref:caspase domain-containing protein n=1 Tax=Aestuariivirga sp. TaxID=2650926 RepID=UPI00378526CF